MVEKVLLEALSLKRTLFVASILVKSFKTEIGNSTRIFRAQLRDSKLIQKL
jgi:hypothetical protein